MEEQILNENEVKEVKDLNANLNLALIPFVFKNSLN